MLKYPPFFQIPLVIEYIHKGFDSHIRPEDEHEMIKALQHRGRVRGIRLHAPYSRTVFRALDGDFPILECLYLKVVHGNAMNWEPPSTFRTPCLQQLVLNKISCPLRSRLLTPAAGLVTLSLTDIHQPDKFSLNDLLQLLTLIPRLVTLRIGFALFSGDPIAAPIRTHVRLYQLHRLICNGSSTFLGALLPHISAPFLRKLQIYISNGHTQSIPSILQPINSSGNLRSRIVDLIFLEKGVFIKATLFDETRWFAFQVSFHGNDFTSQVLSATRFFYLNRMCFFTTKFLTVHCRTPTSLQAHLGPNRIQWHALFGQLPNVTDLTVHDGPNGEISRSFQMNHGESSFEVFPRVNRLLLSSSKHNTAWGSFTKARGNAGRLVQVVPVGKGPSAVEVVINCEAWEAPWLWGSFRVRLN